MLEDITYIFEKNFRRINNLLLTHEELKKAGIKVSRNDILRAVVVLMHSSLEDFLRSILKWKLPSASPEVLRNVSLTGTSASGRKTKFELVDIIPLKGKTVDEIIELSINEYLNVVSFNNTNDICRHLSNIGMDTVALEGYLNNLNKMIERRHKIVHQSDRQDDVEIRNRKVKYLSIKTVKLWRDNLDQFVVAVTNELRE